MIILRMQPNLNSQKQLSVFFFFHFISMSDLNTNSKNGSITCALLDGSPNNNILLKYPSLNIGELTSTTVLFQIIFNKLTTDYPGVNDINIYLLNEDYVFCFGTSYSSNEEFLIIPNKRFSKETLEKLFTCIIYIKITNLYNIEDFVSIQKVKCTFISPQNEEFLKNILIPNNFTI